MNSYDELPSGTAFDSVPVEEDCTPCGLFDAPAGVAMQDKQRAVRIKTGSTKYLFIILELSHKNKKTGNIQNPFTKETS